MVEARHQSFPIGLSLSAKQLWKEARQVGALIVMRKHSRRSPHLAQTNNARQVHLQRIGRGSADRRLADDVAVIVAPFKVPCPFVPSTFASPRRRPAARRGGDPVGHRFRQFQRQCGTFVRLCSGARSLCGMTQTPPPYDRPPSPSSFPLRAPRVASEGRRIKAPNPSADGMFSCEFAGITRCSLVKLNTTARHVRQPHYPITVAVASSQEGR